MKTTFYVHFMVLITAILAILATYTESKASGISNEQLEEDAIREVINQYFDARYRSRKNNKLEDFQGIKAEAALDFKSELNKLEIEIYNAILHHLKYSNYSYSIVYSDISIDNKNQIANVSLVEGYDVVFEISQMINDKEPVVSKMRNLIHHIQLKKEQGVWRLISDQYEDNLWQLLNTTNLSNQEIKTMLYETYLYERSNSSAINRIVTNEPYLCNDLLPLQSDFTTHPYERNGAVNYAHQFALSRNTRYFYFEGNDCTNFVNQAIHHGSYAAEGGLDTFGWYYNSQFDYSSSWSDANFLFEFITQYYYNDNYGPEGCQYNYNYMAMEGDLVQFEWGADRDANGDLLWDHTAIIVSKYTPPDDPFHPYYYIAQHSYDLDNHPLHSVTYQSIRFLNIVRIDGRINSFLPSIVSSTQISSYPDAYPPPLEFDVKNYGEMLTPAYPAP